MERPRVRDFILKLRKQNLSMGRRDFESLMLREIIRRKLDYNLEYVGRYARETLKLYE